MWKGHCNQKAMNMIHIHTEMYHTQPRKLFLIHFLDFFFKLKKKILWKYYKIVFSHFRNTETLVHLLKGSLGTGILAMPKAFHQAGYVSGVVNTILIGILCTWGLHILVSQIIRIINKKKSKIFFKENLQNCLRYDLNTFYVNVVVFQC